MAEATKIYEWLTELSIDYNVCFHVEPLLMIEQRHIVIYDKEDKSHFADCNIPEVIFDNDDLDSFKLYINGPLWSFGIDLDEEEEK